MPASNGMVYTGTSPDAAVLLTLTSADYADLEANFPLLPVGLNQDQFNRWCAQSYFFRHFYDNIDVTAFD